MDQSKLLALLSQDEGPKLDFKANLFLNTDSERKELTKDVIAIANSRGGRGYIVFGVADKSKQILGIQPQDFKEEQIQQIVYMRCDPPVPISIDIFSLQDKFLAVMTIFKSVHKPHQLIQNGSFYVRRGSTTDVARRNEIANLFQENGLLSYETVVLKNVATGVFNAAMLKRYFAVLGVVGEKPNELLMEAMGIIGKAGGDAYHPTIGGILLFGEQTGIYLPHAYVKVVFGDEVRYFYGNIIQILDDVSACLEEKIHEKDYPLDAIKEAIANALVHRDYLDNTRGITVSISHTVIEISNPGALIASNNIYKFIKDKNPVRRNPWLYQRLMILDEKERFIKLGTGIGRITRAFAKIGEVKFLNLGAENIFKVIFPRRKKSHFK